MEPFEWVHPLLLEMIPVRHQCSWLLGWLAQLGVVATLPTRIRHAERREVSREGRSWADGHFPMIPGSPKGSCAAVMAVSV